MFPGLSLARTAGWTASRAEYSRATARSRCRRDRVAGYNRSMRGLALVALCGCNQIFGLSKTHLEDAAYFDAPADAPFTCPASGVPAFKPDLHAVTTMNCRSYTTAAAAGLAAADCDGGPWGLSDNVYVVFPIDRDPDPKTVTPVLHAASYASTLIDPEGDQLFITYYTSAGGSGGLVLVSYVASAGSWTAAPTPSLPMGFATGDKFSTPTRRSNRRAMYFHSLDQTWHELTEATAGTWIEVRSHPELGGTADEPRLSADGLRLTASRYDTSGFDVPVYASRATIDDAFTPFAHLATVQDSAQYPFLSDDCGRLYFTSASSVFYAQQL